MKLLCCLVLCAVVACGGPATKRATGPEASGESPPAAAAARPGEGVPCTQEVALVCPEGQIDACEKALAEPDPPPPQDEDESGGSGTAMALDEGRMSKLERAGNHRCVDR